MTPSPEQVRLERVTDRERYVPVLLEGDESEPILRGYLDEGDLYEIVSDEGPIGAILLIPEDDGLEIKNVAIVEAYRGRGLGRATIEAVERIARRSGARRIQVGTADTSSGTIAFYRRVGFRDAGRIIGFFDSYPEPVVEDGQVAHDMVRFEMELGP